ncbi:GEVED domain-containing protein [Dokdonella fugitiva]|uniref:Fibronectin type-III domain-containing protein n=1 Tax=Dokdonella fugitiva TaxID=328517 RepID=A0A4V2S1Y3_9GAMM|nr:GEVED domain-containing protein [Dokdonella fugitiva]TCO38350.1 hypothetical protein EV148_108188 [Dokdonella fugitiva]
MRVCHRLRAFVGLAVLLSTAIPVLAHARIVTIEINQAKGVDTNVDYARLVEYGPWDDRNYALTQADLAYLPKEETEARDPLPAFFRVWIRKTAIAEGHPLPTSGPAQYPRSAVNTFLQRFEGIQIDGHIYRGINRIDGNRFEVFDEEELEEMGENWPRFVTGEVKITTPVGAEETAIAVNPVDTNFVIAGSNGPGSGQKMWRSTDGGATWSTAISLPGNTCCDATVGWSTDGQIAYTASLVNCGASCGVDFFRSLDKGATWTRSAGLVSSGSDKEYLHVDSYPGSPYKDNIYVSWHQANVQKFARSTDKGLTFSTPLTLDTAFKGIGSDITTDKQGNVYYFFPSTTGSNIRVVKSTDGGATFASSGVTVANTVASFDFPLPSMSTRNAFIYVAADTDLSNGPYGNSIYVAWPDTYNAESGTAANNHARVQVAYSRDGGATWNVTTPHPTSDGQTVDRYQQWLKVDDWGRVHVVYYDTRHSSNRTGVDLYYSVSLDGAQTWETPRRLTTVTSPKINTSMEWGDYNGMDMAMNDIIAIYTDNRAVNNGDVWGVGGFADAPEPDYRLGVPTTTQYACAGSAIDPVSVGVNSLAGYSGTVTLSLPGLDGSAFTGGLFAPNPVTPPTNGGTTSVLTLGTQPGAATGTYTVTVRGTDNQAPPVVKDVSFAVQIAAGQPGTPSPSLPANGATGTPRQPVFTWGADPVAVGYTIEIATDAAFTTIVDTGTPTAATYTPTNPLQPLTTYYWRVRSNSPCGNSTTSQVFSFTTGVTFPEPYCSVAFPNNVEPITHVLVAGIDKTTSPILNGTPALEDFTATVGNVAAGSTASIKVEGNTDGNFTTYISAYIDWNHNGTFDAGEGTNVGSITNSTGTDGKQAVGTITVPSGALSGATRMRVIKKYSSSVNYPGACNTDGYGQAEDYTITVGGDPAYTVGGTVGGLTGSGLVLSLNAGAQTVPVATNGAFTFPTGLANGAAYAVTVGTQPAGQTCSVANGSGTISGANVTNVTVTCAATPTYTIGGNVGGLTGSGLVLSLNAGAQTLPVAANGAFTFPTGLADGAAYAVTVGTQPAGQTCSVANGSGTVSAANVTDVGVACVDDVDDTIFADGFDEL